MIIRNRLRMVGIAICLIGIVLSLADFALAEETRTLLKISVTAQPAEMVEPADVTLNFIIENTGDADAQNVYLSSADGLLSESVGLVVAGEQQSFNRQHSVTAEELAAGEISYTISHDDPENPDGKVNYTVRAEICRSDAQPEVEFTRQLSSRYVEQDGTLTIIYRVRNSGNVTLEDLRVQDALGDYTGRIDRLEAGESCALVSRVAVSEECVSSAKLDYTVKNGEDVNLTLEDVPIYIAQTELEMQFSAVYAPFSTDTAEVLLTLTNTGNVDIHGVRVTDESYGGVIAENLVIPAGGEAVELSRSYALRGEMQFRWQVQGVSGSGKEILLDTGTEALTENQTENPFVELHIEAATLTPRIRKSGDVNVFVRIDNIGEADARNVILSEESMGDVHCFAIIPDGDSVSREFSVHVSGDTSYHFSIRYTDAQGEEQRLDAEPVEFEIASDGVLPEGAKNSFIEFTGKSIKIGGSSTFAALMIAGCTVLLVLIALLMIASRRARFERRVRIAAEKQRPRAETGKGGARPAKSKTKGR